MFKSKTPIGVDIGSHSVKVCQLRRTGEIFELEKFGVAEIYPEGDPPDDAEEQHRAKVDALRRALDVGQIRAKHTVSSVCGESIIVRYLQLPEMPEEELKKALQWEAEEYIPFRLSEVNIDSMILGQVQDSDIPKMDVLLVSAKKDLVNNHVAVLREAGLEPRIIDVDAFAFLNCFELNHTPPPGECVALVNIGSEITSINVFSDGVSRFSRDIPVGGETMTQAIKSRLGCTHVEAERLKISQGAPIMDTAPAEDASNTTSTNLMETLRGTIEDLTNEQEESEGSPEVMAQKAVVNVMNNLFSEVHRSIEFFESQYRSTNVSRVILGGGTAGLRNLPEAFERDLQLSVETIDPLRRIRVGANGPKQEEVGEIRQQLGVGIGLGIRGLLAA